jgi:hypothetical protein
MEVTSSMTNKIGKSFIEKAFPFFKNRFYHVSYRYKDTFLCNSQLKKND